MPTIHNIESTIPPCVTNIKLVTGIKRNMLRCLPQISSWTNCKLTVKIVINDYKRSFSVKCKLYAYYPQY